MTPAARSVNVFGIYLLVLAVFLLVTPDTLLKLFGLPPTTEVWIRVVGMACAYGGIYYRTAAAAELLPFFVTTVMTRLTIPLFYLGFVLADWVRWPILLFSLVDVAGAAWTWRALRHPVPG